MGACVRILQGLDLVQSFSGPASGPHAFELGDPSLKVCSESRLPEYAAEQRNKTCGHM
jgi:hypothetical protein